MLPIGQGGPTLVSTPGAARNRTSPAHPANRPVDVRFSPAQSTVATALCAGTYQVRGQVIDRSTGTVCQEATLTVVVGPAASSDPKDLSLNTQVAVSLACDDGQRFEQTYLARRITPRGVDLYLPGSAARSAGYNDGFAYLDGDERVMELELAGGRGALQLLPGDFVSDGATHLD